MISKFSYEGGPECLFGDDLQDLEKEFTSLKAVFGVRFKLMSPHHEGRNFDTYPRVFSDAN